MDGRGRGSSNMVYISIPATQSWTHETHCQSIGNQTSFFINRLKRKRVIFHFLLAKSSRVKSLMVNSVIIFYNVKISLGLKPVFSPWKVGIEPTWRTLTSGTGIDPP